MASTRAYPLPGWIPGPSAPGPLEAELLWTIIAGMLGIGGMRAYEKCAVSIQAGGSAQLSVNEPALLPSGELWVRTF